MKQLLLGLALFTILNLGCARVRVEAPKDPIKVDISMRLDVYQHVAKDINDIESIVSGTSPASGKSDKQSLLSGFVGIAYAQEALGPEVEQAALRRRDRRPDLVAWLEQGLLGENKSGLIEIRAPQTVDSSHEEAVKAENNDRMIIYKAVAQKNKTSLEEVQKMYAQRLQADAPSGAPVEIFDPSAGKFDWRLK